MFQRDRFDKPYIPNVMIDNKLIIDAFLIAGSMNVSELSQFMMINMIPYSIVDMAGNTLIHKVISEADITKTEYQRLVMIKFLYNENVNPDAPNNMNLTPLHLACVKQYKDIINFLLEIGVDVNYKDNFGNTPLHRLMTGNIIPEEKTTQGNLIPASKKVDSKIIELWKEERSKIWEEIKTSQFIKAIDMTLQSSIGSEDEEKNVVRDFQDRYLAMNLDLTKQDDIKKAKDLIGASMNRFKEIIENKWSKFANNPNISIHNETEDSYPKNLPNKLSIIKAANTENNIKVNIKANMQKIIDTNNIRINNIDSTIINDVILEDFLTNNFNLIEQNADHYLVGLGIYQDLDENYIKTNEMFKLKTALDFSDNVIDIDNMTFMGGNRNMKIIYADDTELLDIMQNNNIIGKLLYSLLFPLDLNNALEFNGNFTLSEEKIGTDIFDILCKFLNNYIDDTLTQEEFDLFKDEFTEDADYYKYHSNLQPYIDNIYNYNKVIWIYSFITKYLCNVNIIYPSTTVLENDANGDDIRDYVPDNMKGQISEAFIYLMSGLIHNKGDLNMAISYAMRPKYIQRFCDPTGGILRGFSDGNNINLIKPSIFSALVYLIMSPENINTVVNNTDSRLTNRDDIIAHINGFAVDEELKQIILNTFDITSTASGVDVEPLCSAIKSYCDKQKNPPRMQEILNLIYLLRSHNIMDNDMLYKKIRGMYKDFNYDIEDDIHQYIPGFTDIFESKDDILRGKPKENIIFQEDAFNYWLIAENCLPSESNLFIFHNYNNFFIDDNLIDLVKNILRNKNKLIVSKYIESHFLGLEFIGIMDEINNKNKFIINNNEIRNQIQLYNIINILPAFDINSRFNNRREPNPDPRINNYINYAGGELETIISDLNLLNINIPGTRPHPTSIVNYIGGLMKNITSIQTMISNIHSRIKYMFNNFNTAEKSSTYATVIAYSYPYLVTFTKYLQRMSNHMKTIAPQYTEAFNYINRIMRQFKPNNPELHYNMTEILNNIDTFNLSLFERNVNNINANLFLLYYMSTNMEVMKIPKFIYHQLGDKPLLVFDENTDIIINKPNGDGDNFVENIKRLDNIKGSDNRLFGSYRDVYTNSLYHKKEIYDRAYNASKKSKLPPSLRSILYYFYNYHVVETIKSFNPLYSINPELIPGDVNDDMKVIQNRYIVAKMIEELFQLYFKNKIEEYGNNIYNKLIGNNPRTASIEIEKIFGSIDFTIKLNKPVSDTIINYITDQLHNNRNLLTSLFQFTEMKEIKPQFYIYPEKYFETTLLKNKYRVKVDDTIITNIMENGANIFNHNEDSNSAIVMMIKNKYHPGLKILSNYIKKDDYNKNKFISPHHYMEEQYKAHTILYNDNFSDTQYKEIVTIIQANDTFRHNILKYLDTSFKTVMYMTEHYLSELLLRLSDDFTNNDLNNILTLLNFKQTDLPNQKSNNYNDNLGNIIKVPTNDYNIVANNIIRDMRKQKAELGEKLQKYIKEKALLNNAGLRDNMDNKITNIQDIITNINTNINNLRKITKNTKIQTTNTLSDNPKIIQRYEDTLRGMNMNINCYMEGWRQYLEKIPRTIENIPSLIIQNTSPLGVLEKYYNHITSIIKDYFEKPRYLDDNKPLNFVYEMLVHNTKVFICGNINNIIKRILFEYIIETNKTGITNAMEMIDYMVEPIKDYLYNTIPSIFVRNSVGIFKNYNDEMENISMTVAEVLNNLLDLLVTSSPIKIDSYVLNIMKNNVNQYFDTIVYKIINNWNVVVENMFIFNINQHRNILCLLALR